MKKELLKELTYRMQANKVGLVIIAGTLAIIFMIDFPSLMAKPETIWSAYYVNSELTSGEAQVMVGNFRKEYLKDDNEYHEYIFDTNINFSVEEAGVRDLDHMAKFTSLIAAKALDFVISDEHTISHYVSLGGFVDLTTIFDEKDLDKLKGDLVYMTGKDGEEKAYAINLANTAAFSSNEKDEKILGAIPLKSERTEITKSFIEYVYNINH